MIRRLLQAHESPRLVEFSVSVPGKLLVWITGTVLLLYHDVNVLMLSAFLLVNVYPDHRRKLLALAALGILFGWCFQLEGIELSTDWTLFSTMSAGQWAEIGGKFTGATVALYAIFQVATRFQSLPKFVRTFPQLAWHAILWAFLFAASLPMLGILNGASFLAWRIGYMFSQAQRGRIAASTFSDHILYLVPVFSGTPTPYGKGLDYLGRHEAADPPSMARSQLAGIKLLVLAIFLTLFLNVLDAVIFGRTDALAFEWIAAQSLNFPALHEMLAAQQAPSPVAAWAGIYLELIRTTVVLAIGGHVIVGCLRLLGFNVFRNTYRPLLAESVIDFWNRYYYYFKELLVEFFFYPVYLRCTRLSPNLRILVAIVAAAFVGNIYYHILSSHRMVTNLEFELLWTIWSQRSVYCFFLAIGIWISMLRQQKKRSANAQPGIIRRVRAIAGVWTFFGIINIWNISPESVDLADRLLFIGALMGYYPN